MKKSTKWKWVGGAVYAVATIAMYIVPAVWQITLIYIRYGIVANVITPHWSLFLYIPAVLLSLLPLWMAKLMRAAKKKNRIINKSEDISNE